MQKKIKYRLSQVAALNFFSKMPCLYKINFTKGEKTDVVADSNDEGPHRIVRQSLEEFSDACFAAEFICASTTTRQIKTYSKNKEL